ncbi:hypothetical protein [Micromonospora sp. NPDC005324]|uniref:hypothetical protein n=1 Tax=Micromonospora sp. NPDC005324 TaxID=3157033 RepID=UPI0033B8F1C2
MQHSRFVFLAAPMPGPYQGQTIHGILWMLVSPNNRPLGRGAVQHEVYARCHESVLELRANVDRIVSQESTVPASGQWTWRIQIADVTVALSSRSYLRARECHYNLGRFLEALPHAEVVAGTRAVRRDRRRPTEPSTPITGGALGTPLARPARVAVRPPYRLEPWSRDVS